MILLTKKVEEARSALFLFLNSWLRLIGSSGTGHGLASFCFRRCLRLILLVFRSTNVRFSRRFGRGLILRSCGIDIRIKRIGHAALRSACRSASWGSSALTTFGIFPVLRAIQSPLIASTASCGNRGTSGRNVFVVTTRFCLLSTDNIIICNLVLLAESGLLFGGLRVDGGSACSRRGTFVVFLCRSWCLRFLRRCLSRRSVQLFDILDVSGFAGMFARAPAYLLDCTANCSIVETHRKDLIFCMFVSFSDG